MLCCLWRQPIVQDGILQQTAWQNPVNGREWLCPATGKIMAAQNEQTPAWFEVVQVDYNRSILRLSLRKDVVWSGPKGCCVAWSILTLLHDALRALAVDLNQHC